MVWDIAESELQRQGHLVAPERVALALKGIYWWMTVGLLLTGVVALGVYESGLAIDLARSGGLYLGLVFAEIGLVLALTWGLSRMSPAVAAAAFLVYAALNGLTLSVVFLVYTASSIATTFFVTAGTFGAMAAYGTFTRRSLASWGSFLFMGLVGLILALVVNAFLRSPALDFVVSCAGVLIFTGLAAYDANKLRRMAQQGAIPLDKLEIYGALTLYLDFVNLFLYLLRFLGRRR